MIDTEGIYPELDHEAVFRITAYWASRYADVMLKHYEATGAEFGAFADVAQQIGFTETRRVINYYLMVAKEPTLEEFLEEWPRYQYVAHATKHDRMYRHPDPRPHYGESEE